MPKTKFEELFEVFAIVDHTGLLAEELNGNLAVFRTEQEAFDNCNTEDGERVVRVRGTYRYKVDVE